MADILLLKTDRQLASNTAGFFKRAGHNLRYFSDPQAAVVAIDKSKPDLIIVDLFLAARSGIEFLFELRSYPEWESLLVLVSGGLSAEEIKNYRAAFKELNVGLYFQKTASLKVLLTAAERLLHPAPA
jgi:DNA-binding response OmpR family regulator